MSIISLQATFETNATRSLQWRRLQLEGLYHLLQDNFDALVAAYPTNNVTDATLELFSAVKQISEAVNVLARAVRWNSIASSGFFSRRQASLSGPVGPVLLCSTADMPYASLFSTLIPAVAAGNVCALVIESESVRNELRSLLPRYMDRDAITVMDNYKAGEILAGRSVFAAVLQVSDEQDNIEVTNVIPKPMGPSVAYLDKSLLGGKQTIEAVASSTVDLNTAFQGKSPLAPKIVYVHEAIYDQFLGAVSRSAQLPFNIISDKASTAIPQLNGLQIVRVKAPDEAIIALAARSPPSVTALYHFAKAPIRDYLLANVSHTLAVEGAMPRELLVDLGTFLAPYLPRLESQRYYLTPRRWTRRVDDSQSLRRAMLQTGIVSYDQGTGINVEFFDQVKMAFKAAKVVGWLALLSTGYVTFRRFTVL